MAAGVPLDAGVLRAQAEAPAPAPAGAPAQRVPEPPPLAPAVKGARPKSDASVLPPAATTLPADLKDLRAPASLALPVKPAQVAIDQLRPLSLADTEVLAEVGNPELKAVASQVQQAQSALRAEIARWYPRISLNASNVPAYAVGDQFRSTRVPGLLPGTSQVQESATSTSIWRFQAALEANWALIDPSRTPSIAAARDDYEKQKNAYLIALRKLRLDASLAYFDLQSADEQVRIGQESVRASLVSLRDARARFQAGVATKLEVYEAETQLARDQQLLTNAVANQAIARRNLASLLDLPQTVTPTAKDPSRVVGVWLPSLQESIIAAYAFREELDQALLDISIANSRGNAALAEVQPFLRIFNTFSTGRAGGYDGARTGLADSGDYSWSVENSVGMRFDWTVFDGGAARARYRGLKQKAEENRFLFARTRDEVRFEVEQSFYNLERNNRNIATTSREVISSREALRLARLRFQAGVTTQREVVDNQRDLTQAEVRYSDAIVNYNKSLAELRRRTGLDQVAFCAPLNLPATKPRVEGASDVPVEPRPLLPACRADASVGGG
jgi:OMF family outer membrane factor